MIGEKTIYDRVILTTPTDIVVYYFNNSDHTHLTGIKWEKFDSKAGEWNEYDTNRE